MLRTHLRSLTAIQADLGRRAGVEDLAQAARKLFLFYDQESRLADVLTGSAPPPPTKPAYKRGKPKPRKRRLKLTTGDHVLLLLQETGEALSSRQIVERLVKRGHEEFRRQTMSYVLNGLAREGKVKRIETGTIPVRALWRAVG